MSKFHLGSVAGLSLMTALAAPSLAQSQTPVEYEDEIIVTGSPLGGTVNESIVGVSVLAGEELDRRLASTIGETLKFEPGVSSTFFGAGASRPIIRGQGGTRVRVLTNGIGSIDASSNSPDHAVTVEPAQAKRIEVIRGAGLLRFGSSGAGGVVNVIDHRFETDVPEQTETAFRLQASSVNRGFEAAATIDQPLSENFVLHLDGTYRDANDYDIPNFAESARLRAFEEEEEHDHDDDEDHEDEDHDEHDHDEDEDEVFGRLDNSFVESKSGTVGLSWVGERATLGAAVFRNETQYGIPGGHEHTHGHDEDEDHDEDDHDEDHEDEDHDEHDHEEGEEGDVFIDLEQTRLDLNAMVELGGVFDRLQFFGGYADYRHREFEGPGEIGTTFTNEGYEGRLELVQRQSGAWSGAHGIHVRRRDFVAIGEEAFVPPTQTQEYAAYTFHEFDLDEWHLEGAGRIETTDHENSAAGDRLDFTAISLSAGADFHLTDTIKLGGTIFRTERAPATEELFSNGPHLATDQFEVGDPTLGKETATGIELAFRQNAGPVSTKLNLFYTSYDDYIFEAATGLEEDELAVFQFTADDAEFYGFESETRLTLVETYDWNVRADFLTEYVRAKTNSGNLPRIPPVSILAGLEARKADWSWRAEVDWAAAQTKVAQFELPTDDYALVNLSTRYDFDDQISFGLAVENVFDEDARQHTSFLKDDLPLPGRNFKFTVSAKI